MFGPTRSVVQHGCFEYSLCSHWGIIQYFEFWLVFEVVRLVLSEFLRWEHGSGRFPYIGNTHYILHGVRTTITSFWWKGLYAAIVTDEVSFLSRNMSVTANGCRISQSPSRSISCCYRILIRLNHLCNVWRAWFRIWNFSVSCNTSWRVFFRIWHSNQTYQGMGRRKLVLCSQSHD